MTSWEQALARSKMEYLEKYKSGKLSDLDHVKRWLGYNIEFAPDKRSAIVHAPTGPLEVRIRDDYK